MHNKVTTFIVYAKLWIIDAILLVSIPKAYSYNDACFTHTGMYGTLCVPRQ